MKEYDYERETDEVESIKCHYEVWLIHLKGLRVMWQLKVIEP